MATFQDDDIPNCDIHNGDTLFERKFNLSTLAAKLLATLPATLLNDSSTLFPDYRRHCYFWRLRLLVLDNELKWEEMFYISTNITILQRAKATENIIHLLPSDIVVMHFEVPNYVLSTNTTYGCYLVYKIPPDFDRKTMVGMKLDGGSLLPLSRSQHVPLSIPECPGVFRSPNPINTLKSLQLPTKRKDGWLEVKLGNTSHIQWKNMQQDELSSYFQPREKSTWKSCCLPWISDNESSDHYFTKVTISLDRIDRFNQTPELFVQGIEFRPL
ncbi:hypothetical protein L1987_80879 [Smallanthus sonchifolius]|uniref:Uncharacterized protein n=1 Tax=Smallanthus sonchifolius TaxID=185202 RepID=A0ACB8YP00_9ASTR|nr:hypothetical protein L1987_80879 [Smallanthus sonchifolius]